MRVFTIAALILLTSSASAIGTKQVPLISLDENAQPKVIYIPSGEFIRILSEAYSTVQDAMNPVLLKLSARAGSQLPSGWELNSIAVGVGLSASLQAGPFGSISFSPRIEIIYSSDGKPPPPNS